MGRNDKWEVYREEEEGRSDDRPSECAFAALVYRRDCRAW